MQPNFLIAAAYRIVYLCQGLLRVNNKYFDKNMAKNIIITKASASAAEPA